MIHEPGIRGPYRCQSIAYALGVHEETEGGTERELVSYHWHPNTRSPFTQPHFHVGKTRVEQDQRLHVPTPRFTVEDFVEMLIDSFGVAATVDEETWRALLAESREIHERYRSWGEYGEAPQWG